MLEKFNGNIVFIILGILLGLLFGYLLAKIFFLMKIKKYRSESVKKSRDVVLGHVNEKIAPLLPNFPYSYKDLVFLGKGVDYVVFDGLARGDLKKIVFLEIKSGVSQLNKNEIMIKNCINKGNILYDLFRL